MSKSSPIAPKEQNPIEALALLETAKKYGTEVRVRSNGNLRFATLWERFVSAVSSLPKIFQSKGPPEWESKAREALQAKFGKINPSGQENDIENPVYLTCITSDSDKTVYSPLKNYLGQINEDQQLRQQAMRFYMDIDSGEIISETAKLDDLKADEKFDQITSTTAHLMNKGYVYDEALAIARGVSYLAQKHGASEEQALEVHKIIFLLKSENLTDKNLKGTALLDHGWNLLKGLGGKKMSTTRFIRTERLKIKNAQLGKISQTPASIKKPNNHGIFFKEDNQINNYSLKRLKPLLPLGMHYSKESNLYALNSDLSSEEKNTFFELMQQPKKSEETQFIDPATEQASASSLQIGESVIALTDLSKSLVSDSSRQKIKVIHQTTGAISYLDHLPPLEFVSALSDITGIKNKQGLIYLSNFFCQDFELNLQSIYMEKIKTGNDYPFQYAYIQDQSKKSTDDEGRNKEEITLTITPEGNFLLGLTYQEKINQISDPETGLLYPVNQSESMQGTLNQDNAGLAVECEVAVSANSLMNGTPEYRFSNPPAFGLRIEPTSLSETTQ